MIEPTELGAVNQADIVDGIAIVGMSGRFRVQAACRPSGTICKTISLRLITLPSIRWRTLSRPMNGLSRNM